MTDWVVWPIFSIQAIAFILLIVPKHFKLFGTRFKAISLGLLFISCVLIGLSLYHDSTEVLNLHF